MNDRQSLEELAEPLNDLVAWNTRYPSHRIFNETEIRHIAAEMDAIVEKARAALAATGLARDEP